MVLNRVAKSPDIVSIRNILVSTADKTGLGEFVSGVLAICPEATVYSTGGTFALLEKLIPVGNLRAVSSYTGQPEMQGGLVKTLDYRIYLGLLSEPYNPDHLRDIERTNAISFDMVVVNLYPFMEQITRSPDDLEGARANIDIGGPCMIRAAAKNYLRVASVTSPGVYEQIIAEMRATSGGVSLATRYRLACSAFRHTAEYDTAIADYLAKVSHPEEAYETE
ncbi:MAG: hypothetical protein EA426_08240 [Spirochaetaceae bacterium]|nr:MAG: hypothetical protein EA426_08240 [Spirochaetaceae bacterium]